MVNSKFNKKKFELCEWPFLLVYQRSEIDISKTTIVFFVFMIITVDVERKNNVNIE